jgi:pimeloyl-ACP methyl ester carboxylesterase
MPYVETSDSTRLFFTEGGRGKPVVFVAGAWLNSQMWEFQMPDLVHLGLRCVAYDRRGHGRSDWSWEGYDYDTLADDLATLLKRLDLNAVTLVGHSMGGGEVIRYLTRHGASRVERIALVAATAPFPMETADNPGAIDRMLIEVDLAARTADRPRWFADNADAFFGIGLPGVSVSPELTEYMIRQCLDCSARAAEAFFIAGYTTDLRAELRAITVPTLIVHGDHDVQAPVDICGRRIAPLVPNATFLSYENAAHGLFITHADRLNVD